VNANQATLPVGVMCRLLEVSPSGFYAWQDRALSAHARADVELTALIQQIHEQSYCTYGHRRIHVELRERYGKRVGRKRVARLMRAAGLQGVHKKRFRCTTRSGTPERFAPDRVERHFVADGPDVLWVADVTYVPTDEGLLYLAMVLDVFSRLIVGWSMDRHVGSHLVLTALEMAYAQRTPHQVIHHSDHGSEYTAIAFGARSRRLGIELSMGSVGDCFDNAMAESFFATLECEVLDRHHFRTRDEARVKIFSWIEGWYNLRRRHSSIEYRSPREFEQRSHKRSRTGPQELLPRVARQTALR
jgi:putative transposase